MKKLFLALYNDLTAALRPAEWRAIFGKLKVLKTRDFKAIFRSWLPQLVLYYILFSPLVAAPLYGTALFHPSMAGLYDAHTIRGLPIENVYFDSSNGKRLHGWYLRKSDSRFVVLFNHGNAGNLTSRIPLLAALLDCGLSVLIYDYQGYGRSQGSASVDAVVADGQAAYDWLVARKGWSGKDIIVFGESLGTGVASQIAATKPVSAIVLQSPYTSLIKLAREKLPFLYLYPCWLFPKQQLDSLKILSGSHAPLLLLHGRNDRLIPCSHSEAIFRAAPPEKKLCLFQECGHNDLLGKYKEAYMQALSRLVHSLH